MNRKRVSILGFGFSGLSAAWAFQRQGYEVNVFEKSEGAGGLLQSHQTEYGLIETAANAILRSEGVKELGQDIGIQWAERKKTIKNKWVYVDQPRRWPLSFKETAQNLIPLFKLATSSQSMKPHIGESVSQWGQRTFKNKVFVEHLLGPALQGIYAQGPEMLSATLSLKSLFSQERIRTEGSHAPQSGMSEFFDKGLKHLEKDSKFKIHFQSNTESENLDSSLIIDTRPDYKNVDYLSVTSVTLFFEEALRPKIQGFGCLFAESQRILGVLFNSDIFEGRAKSGLFSETWILSGDSGPNVIKEILTFREEKFEIKGDPLFFKTTSWEKGIPNYNLKHENYLLNGCDLEKNLQDRKIIKLSNHTGEIGLNKILEHALRLSKKEY